MARASVLQHLTAVSQLVGQIGDADAVERGEALPITQVVTGT